MNSSSNKSRIIPFYLVAFMMIIIDQATKLYFKGFDFLGIIHKGYSYGEQVPVLGTFLNWTYIENPGMAFGIEFGWGKIFLSLFSVLASILLFILIGKLKNHNFWIRTGFTLIFAGAVGNLIDRVFYGVFFGEGSLFYGRVVDFIQVDIPDIPFLGWTYFPVFNIADSCVTVGVCILILAHSKLPEWRQLFPVKQSESTTLLADEQVKSDESND